MDAEPKDVPQLVVMAADGGEATVQLTDFPLGAGEFAWAQDSRRIAVEGTRWRDELAGLDESERARTPRRITDLNYRFDDEGWLVDQVTNVFVVVLDGDVRGDAAPVQVSGLADGDDTFSESGPDWKVDGTALAWLSSRHRARERDLAVQPFRVAIDDVRAVGAPEALSDPGDWVSIRHRADGSAWLLGLADTFAWPDVVQHQILADDGTLTGPFADLDRSTGVAGGRVVDLDDGAMLLAVEDRGTVRLERHDPAGNAARLIDGQLTVTGWSARSDGGFVAAVVSTPMNPGELVVLRDGSMVPETVTAINSHLAAEIGLLPLHHDTFTVTDPDGTEVEHDLFVVLPPGDGPVPVLLNIHGGPAGMYGFGFFDEFQVYASAGFGVVGINPRGSAGAGTAWLRGVIDTWSGPDSPDWRDLEAAVPAALARHPRLDGSRRGVMGGSYGGFATATLIARNQSWASAVVERGLLAWESFGGTSDIGRVFDRMYLGVSIDDGTTDLPGDQVEADERHRRLRVASPLWRAKDVRTPTLIVHSEEDWRCPIEQAEQYFALLRRAGVQAEFLRFPGEGHEMSRSGTPRHRVERFAAILGWHGRHLD